MAKIEASLSDVTRFSAMGPMDSPISSSMYGIGHRQLDWPVPIPRDHQGYTFFTRPQLNLSLENLRHERKFIPLTTENDASYQRAIRCYLDPRLGFDTVSCPFVDNTLAFIPLLTNHVRKLGPWPDLNVESYTAKPGMYGEEFGFVDGTYRVYGARDMTASFRNMMGSPIMLLFQTWIIYASNVFEGIMMPYPDFLAYNEIDYNTCIYRITLDPSKKYVEQIASTLAYPTGVSTGAVFNLDLGDGKTPFSDGGNTLDINFKCFGAQYNDDILIHNFNDTVEIFNPNMAADKISNMKKIPDYALAAFDGEGYPRINPSTYEMEWYVSQGRYAERAALYESHLQSIRVGSNSATVFPDPGRTIIRKI